MTTKEKILHTAIELFAERGFSDVSIREITREVGIKESSLYNHFTSKQQILDEIFAHLSEEFEKKSIPEEDAVRFIEKMNPAEFMEMCMMNFRMYFGDPKLMKIWRIISIERFRNEKANEFFTRNLIDAPLAYQSTVFASMMDKGLIKKADPMVLARAFYSFMLFLYMRYFEVNDGKNPADDAGIQEMVKAHMEFLTNVIGSDSV